jgi:hypothetical protein
MNLRIKDQDAQWNSAFLTFSFIMQGASKKVLQFLDANGTNLQQKTFVSMNRKVFYEHCQKV